MLAAELRLISVLTHAHDAVAAFYAVQSTSVLLVGAGALYSFSLLFAGVAVARWVFVTTCNAAAWSVHLETTPGWAVGWFFVPIANLWKPFSGIRHVYQASLDPLEPARVRVPPTFSFWWTGWIVANLMSSGVRVLSHTHALGGGVDDLAWHVAALGMITAQTVALIGVLRLTTRAQVGQISAAQARVFD